MSSDIPQDPLKRLENIQIVKSNNKYIPVKEYSIVAQFCSEGLVKNAKGLLQYSDLQALLLKTNLFNGH